MRLLSVGCLTLLVLATVSNTAFSAITLVDFEEGFTHLQQVGTVYTADNAVTFSLQPQIVGSTPAPFIANTGSSPTAFTGSAGYDRVYDADQRSFFLTDENRVGSYTNSSGKNVREIGGVLRSLWLSTARSRQTSGR